MLGENFKIAEEALEYTKSKFPLGIPNSGEEDSAVDHSNYREFGKAIGRNKINDDLRLLLLRSSDDLKKFEQEAVMYDHPIAVACAYIAQKKNSGEINQSLDFCMASIYDKSTKQYTHRLLIIGKADEESVACDLHQGKVMNYKDYRQGLSPKERVFRMLFDFPRSAVRLSHDSDVIECSVEQSEVEATFRQSAPKNR